ncbi:hypothetical protein IWW55_007364, partial [Coemansia sp. RSA 2706]
MSICGSVFRRVLRQRPGALLMRGFASKYAKYNWEDALQLEQQLTDEEKMVRDSAHAYAQEKLLPRVIQATRKEHFDVEIMRELGELG